MHSRILNIFLVIILTFWFCNLDPANSTPESAKPTYCCCLILSINLHIGMIVFYWYEHISKLRLYSHMLAREWASSILLFYIFSALYRITDYNKECWHILGEVDKFIFYDLALSYTISIPTLLLINWFYYVFLEPSRREIEHRKDWFGLSPIEIFGYTTLKQIFNINPMPLYNFLCPQSLYLPI